MYAHTSSISNSNGVVLIQEASKKTRDYILSFGERNCAFILNAFLIQENLQEQDLCYVLSCFSIKLDLFKYLFTQKTTFT
jgi:hypothetical protein